MKLENYFKGAKAYVWKEDLAIVKSGKTIPSAFVNIIDKDEITVIIDQTKIDFDYLKIEKDWKIITLDVVFPPDVVGVTAKISNCLAEANISIMPIAAFSRDHFLVKSKDLKKAIESLEKIGIGIRN